MILDKCLKKEWIEDRSEKFKRGRVNADRELIEKVIYALRLLEELEENDLDFMFKGGTCLLILLEKVHRFSIDIDIIIDNKYKNDIETYINKLTNNSKVFIRYEENKRSSSKNIPKAHYKFFFKSDLDGEDKYILLDILFDDIPYSHTCKKEIRCEFIESDENSIFVNTPSIECILGDKLTAFAPNTTGIPYNKGKELEIIKQLYDISNLFDKAEDFQVVADTFKSVATKELTYRGESTKNYNDVLDDIFTTAMIIASYGKGDDGHFRELQRGVTSIKSYIFSSNFIFENAIECAAKAAYLAISIRYNKYDFNKYCTSIDMNEINMEPPYRKIFKGVKKFSKEAYYYLYKALEIRAEFDDEVAIE